MAEAKAKIRKPRTRSPKLKEKVTPFTVPLYSLKGEESGTLELSKDLFGHFVQQSLLSQAARVYLNNLKAHFSSTKTRGEVSASTRKIYRQKGTGGARHGSLKAPIFVHSGGVALGPKFRKVVLKLPAKMKKAALFSALAQKLAEKEVLGIKDIEKASGKTKEMANLFKQIKKQSLLILLGEKADLAMRAARNLPKVEITLADQVNILQILKHQTLMLNKEALAKLEERLKEKK